MSESCASHCGCSAPAAPPTDPLFRRILIIALVLNGAMFGVEFIGGWLARSSALTADSMDFLSDSVNYAISLAVVGMAARRRAQAALFKGLSLGAVGLWAAGNAVWGLWQGAVPHAETMGGIGFAALAVNAGVAVALAKYRDGDSNMRSIWLCSRNDALGNAAVIAAAAGVWGTQTQWPDLAVAAFLVWLPLSAAFSIVKDSTAELREHQA